MTFNKLIVALSFIGLQLFSSLTYADTFEGVLEMTTINYSSGEKATVTWSIKDGNHRMDYQTTVEGKPFNYTLLFLQGRADVLLLMEGNGKKIAYTVPAGALAISNLVKPNTLLQPGAGEKVLAGLNCTPLVDGKGNVVAWVSAQSPVSVSDAPAALKGQGVFQLLVNNKINSLPLEFNATDAEGKPTYQQTIVSIKQQPVNGAVFDYSSYTPAQEALQELQKQ
ncbi:MAG: hypothetical protein SFW35_01975 [Chitinophagales bacterium]|nr:hypothetical protein [Chitinophagales bacterium]